VSVVWEHRGEILNEFWKIGKGIPRKIMSKVLKDKQKLLK
jgi:hypothetical protein